MNEPEMPVANKENVPTIGLIKPIISNDELECPLCKGKGKLSQVDFFEKLGVKDSVRIAELSAENAMQKMHDTLWLKHEQQMDKSIAGAKEQYIKEISKLKAEIDQFKTAKEQVNSNHDQELELAKEAQRLEDDLAKQTEIKKLSEAYESQKKQIEESGTDAKTSYLENIGKLKAEIDSLKKMKDQTVEQHVINVEQAKKTQLLEGEAAKQKEMQGIIDANAKYKAKITQMEDASKVAISLAVQEAKDKSAQEVEALKKSSMDAGTELAMLKAAVENFPDVKKNEVDKAVLDYQARLNGLELNLNTSEKAVKQLEEENKGLHEKMQSTARQGAIEERAFETMAKEISGIFVSDKLHKNGDYLVQLKKLDGTVDEASTLVIDNKDKGRIDEKDVRKLVRDAKIHKSALAALVVKDSDSFGNKDSQNRFQTIDDVCIIRTTKEWFERDLDFLRPMMAKQSELGPDFVSKNESAISRVKSVIIDVDTIAKSIGTALVHLTKANNNVEEYKNKIVNICSEVV